MMDDELRQAGNLIRTGRSAEARPLLARHVKEHPESEQGWFLLSIVLADRRQQIDCLQRVLHLNPSNKLARERLAQIQAAVGAAAAAASEAGGAKPAPKPAAAKAPSAEAQGAQAGKRVSEAGKVSPPAKPPASAGRAEKGARRPKPGGAKRAATPAPGKRRSPGCLRLGLIVFLAVLVIGIAGAVAIALRTFLLFPTPTPAVAVPAGTATTGRQSLPPSWTPTISPTATLIPTATPTPTLTPSPSPIPPEPTVAALMDRIQVEVADIRGLSIEANVGRYIVSKAAVRPILEGNFLANGGSQAELADESRVLTALGLVKPTYDMFTNALNGLTDSVGGFYFPWSKELYVIGGRFGGIEHFIFSHEYGHALVDQHYDIAQMGVYPRCLKGADYCKALEGLVEGDATLVMQLWWRQYAGPRDYQDILNYVPPQQTLPEQYPPPYVIRDADFPYVEGYNFVRYLYDRGNWNSVNKAYARLPESSEQILHPEKYVANEKPVDVAAPPLDTALGSGWRKLAVDSLGEWMTYLLLGYGADADAQLEDSQAMAAARGWGGDRYQVYFDDANGRSAMAEAWSWDTTRDASEFAQAMTSYLKARFRGATLKSDKGECWEANAQTTCFYLAGQGTLWLLAPDQTMLAALLSQYPSFR